MSPPPPQTGVSQGAALRQFMSTAAGLNRDALIGPPPVLKPAGLPCPVLSSTGGRPECRPPGDGGLRVEVFLPGLNGGGSLFALGPSARLLPGIKSLH